MATLQRISRGTPLRAALTTDNINALFDAYNNVELRDQGLPAAGDLCTVMVSNPGNLSTTAAGTLEPGDAVRLGYPATSATDRVPGMTMPPVCEARDGSADGPVAVVLDRIPAGMVGRAAVAGAVIAKVDILNAAHTGAQLSLGHTMTSSDADGDADILVPEGTGAAATGVKRCLVRLLAGGGGGAAPVYPPAGGPFDIVASGLSVTVRDTLGSRAGFVYAYGWSQRLSSATYTFPANATRYVYVQVDYTPSTDTLAAQIAADTSFPAATDTKWICRLATVKTDASAATIYRHRWPGDIEIIGRWA